MKELKTLHFPNEAEPREIVDAYARQRIANLTISGDAPVLDATLGADGIMTYNNSPAFDEWLTEDEAKGMFAPSGYGLGTYGQTAPNNDANQIKKNGMFRAYVNTPDEAVWWNILNMDCYDGDSTASFQIANGYLSADKASICVRQKYNGTWGEWEWVNPPLRDDVEYRTTERLGGKAVYVKSVDCGYAPNNTTKSTVLIPNTIAVGSIAGWSGYASYVGMALPTSNASWKAEVVYQSNGYCFVLTTNTNHSNCHVYVTVKYTKS